MGQKRVVRMKDREEKAGKEQAENKKQKEYSKREASSASMYSVRV